MPARSCPLDDATMDTITVHGTYTAVEIDMCPTCRGVYMDAGELGRLLNAAKPVAGAPIEGSKTRDLTCPGCSGEMTLRSVEGVPMDQCGACAGLWLDRGELAKVQAHVRHAREDLETLAEEGTASKLYDAISALQ